MSLTVLEFGQRGLLASLARAFDDEGEALGLLESIGFPRHLIPNFIAADSPQAFWQAVAKEIEGGLTEGGLEALLRAAADHYPYNPDFAPYRAEESKSEKRRARGATVVITGSYDLHWLIDHARSIAAARGWGNVELGIVTGSTCQLQLPDATPEAAYELTEELRREGLRARASIAPLHFRDYLLESLRVEGLDAARFELNGVPASTRVQEISRAVTSQYRPDFWPHDRSGRVRPSVVDLVQEDGSTRRLDPGVSLHESGVEDGATLHVAPESTAGGGGFSSLSEGGWGRRGASGPPQDRRPEPPPPPQRRYLNAWFPETIRSGHRVPLLVRVSLHEAAAASTPLRPLPIPRRGIDLTLQVQAPGLVLLDPGTRTVRVTPEHDSDWAVFELQAVAAGVLAVRISAFYLASFLGTLTLQVAVDDRAATGPHADRSSPIEPRRREPGEVTLLIHYDEIQRIYRYQLIDDTVGGLEEVLSSPLRRSPFAAVEDLVGQLNQLARGEVGYSARETRAWLKGQGIQLWLELIPQALQAQFHARRDHIRRMFIVSSGDPIPWELLYPFGHGIEDRGFLAEQFPVARWEYGGAPKSDLRAGRAGLVLPAGSPASATAEIQLLRQLLESRRLAVSSPLAELDELLTLLAEADFHLLHFACHNSFVPDSPSASSIRMGGVPFQLSFLNEHQDRFRDASPVVFFNACRSDGRAPLYTQPCGWAKSFIRAGCGAFIGTQWEVRDGSARTFAEVFYRALTSGSKNLGEAMTAARQAIQDEPGDPSWLAYSFYGDAAATLGDPAVA